MADSGHLGADLVGAAGQQGALHEGQAVPAGQHTVDELGGLGAGCGMGEDLDLLALLVAAQIVGQLGLGRLGHAVHDAEIPLGQLVVLDLVVHDAQSLGGFGCDDDAARVAVDAVAQGRGEGGGVRRVPLARLTQIGLNVRNQGVRVAALVRVDNHARPLVGQQDVVILVQNVQVGDGNFFPCFLQRRAFKKRVVDV